MTRPIYEPSLQRTDARLGYSTSQLLRRPAPSSAAADYPWARFQRKADSNVTVSDSSVTQVQGTAGSDVITDTSIFQINSNLEIEMLQAGLVAIVCHTMWSVYDKTFRLVTAFDVTPFPDLALCMGGISADNFDQAMTSGTARLDVGAAVRMVVSQQSGGNQTLYGAGSDLDDTNWLEVQYLGPWQAP